MKSFLELSHAEKSFGSKRIFQDFNLSLEEGDFTVLLGPSGCGKSTLLRLLAGLEPLDGGGLQQRPGLRSSFVFQEPRLLPWRTVWENLSLPFELGSTQKPLPQNLLQELLRLVGLEQAADLYPPALSGGMKQRVALARALATQPDVLFLDEPFSALDEVTRFQLQDLLRKTWEKTGTSFVFVTHSLSEAAFLGERVLLLGPAPQGLVEDFRNSFKDRGEDLRTSVEFNALIKSLGRSLRAVSARSAG